MITNPLQAGKTTSRLQKFLHAVEVFQNDKHDQTSDDIFPQLTHIKVLQNPQCSRVHWSGYGLSRNTDAPQGEVYSVRCMDFIFTVSLQWQ